MHYNHILCASSPPPPPSSPSPSSPTRTRTEQQQQSSSIKRKREPEIHTGTMLSPHHHPQPSIEQDTEDMVDVDGDALDDQSENLIKDSFIQDMDELENHNTNDEDEVTQATLVHMNQEDNDDDDDDEDDQDHFKYSLHIEVRLRANSTILFDTVRRTIGRYITDNFTTLETHSVIPGWQDIGLLANEVYRVYCAECGEATRLVSVSKVNLLIHVYELPVEGHDKTTMLCAHPADPSSELSHDLEQPDDEPAGDVAASRTELPANRYEGMWESLIYEQGLKTRLLNYIYSSIIFAEQNVNANLIAWHRLLLLHGPPGTGKTSLCKALAQKVSIRLSAIYQKTELVEINSHSLFSKWFSESGKLVHSLFAKIEQIAENTDVFVLVLIDEVESLAGSRSSGASGGEPSDALRAVNSLLTALDKLRHYKNVLVLTTSNLTDSIDHAFLDRADIKQHIGLPSAEAVYWILGSCLQELMATKILKPRRFLDYKDASMVRDDSSGVEQHEGKRMVVRRREESSLKLLAISEAASGMSGRSLRRLPLLAHAMTAVGHSSGVHSLPVNSYLDGMLSLVRAEMDGK
ncbi:hypothetical protein PCANC_13702 [Puccinia coronata f. sp. avenae]|uniref:AAA+ ATPase domain-containing protein n=1 Tax=Puccinia coronata f. sp. avenae TaxID=200324 RepID=A0A2N5SQ22_9BASI|nr:hypothetical protein PCANC_13702 [Puccinia coronata f. sp. avenae]